MEQNASNIKTLIVVIERPNGTTYSQQVEIQHTIRQTLQFVKNCIGSRYKIVDYYVGEQY